MILYDVTSDTNPRDMAGNLTESSDSNGWRAAAVRGLHIESALKLE